MRELNRYTIKYLKPTDPQHSIGIWVLEASYLTKVEGQENLSMGPGRPRSKTRGVLKYELAFSKE